MYMYIYICIYTYMCIYTYICMSSSLGDNKTNAARVPCTIFHILGVKKAKQHTEKARIVSYDQTSLDSRTHCSFQGRAGDLYSQKSKGWENSLRTTGLFQNSSLLLRVYVALFYNSSLLLFDCLLSVFIVRPILIIPKKKQDTRQSVLLL